MAQDAADLLFRERICEGCASIDFDSVFSEAVAKLGQNEASLGGSSSRDDELTAHHPVLWADKHGMVYGMSLRIDHISPNHGCDFCTFLCSIRHSALDQPSDMGLDLLCFQLFRGSKEQTRRLVAVIRISQPSAPSPPDKDRFMYYCRTTKFSKCPSGKKLILMDPDWDAPRITADFAVISEAAAASPCTHHLPSADQSSWERRFMDNIPGWRVIDCATKSVISLSECITAVGSFKNIEYVTLSYVWGAEPSEHSLDARNLPKRLPRVIEDAIETANSLGFRYIWIDRYCIPQDDHRERMNQIRNMNLIYSRSCLAIIASAGSGPEYGLPGVGKTARQLPQTFRCGSHVLRHWLYRPWVRKQIRFSTWNSRAWTFQEAALSPRRLYFTDYFALFEAGDHRDRGLESCIEGSTDCRSSLFMPAWRFDMNELWYVSTYVHRCLSVEADVFCAFQGFQTHLNDVSSDTYLMYGLEVDTKECDLSRALWWCIPHPIERLQERRKAPSWTWLGWRISSKWPHAAWWVVNSFYLGASVRYVGSAKLSLVYDDDYVFPWGTMTREQMVKLTSDRDDGSIKSLIANGWTFSVQDLLSPPPEDDSINPFKEDNPDARDKLARPSLVEKLERAFAFYGLHADQISDPRKALCLVLGSVHLAQGKPSDIVSENPGLLILVVASTDQGETWQRVEALYVEGKTELVDCQWAGFGWVKRKLRIY